MEARLQPACMALACVTAAAFAGAAVRHVPPAAQTPPAIPKFEVVSVKPCREDIAPGTRTGGGNSSPARLDIRCQTVRGLINIAFVVFANGASVNIAAHTPIAGGPAWIDSDRYTIVATTGSPQTADMMQGPMLQALLEDRFQLSLHRATKEVPVYELTVTRGASRLKPFQPGSCVPMDFLSLSPAELAALPRNVNYCRNHTTIQAGLVTVDDPAITLDDFSGRTLADAVDRPVVNRTGMAGLFAIRLEYVPGATSPLSQRAGDASPALGASIFSALEAQLGLKLQPAKALQPYLVIDHVEKPSPN